MSTINKMIADIIKLLAEVERLENMTPEEQAELAHRRAEQARVRMERKNARFAAALARATDIQALRIDRLVSDGYEATKTWTSRANGRVAVMLQKDGVWDQQTGRVRTALVMVYHDGRFQKEFGKVPLHGDWI